MNNKNDHHHKIYSTNSNAHVHHHHDKSHHKSDTSDNYKSAVSTMKHRSGSESDDDDTQHSGLEDDNKRSSVGVKKYVRKLSDSGRKKSTTILRNQQRKSSVGSNTPSSSSSINSVPTTVPSCNNCDGNQIRYTNHSYVEYKIFDPNDDKDDVFKNVTCCDGNNVLRTPTSSSGGLRKQLLSRYSPLGFQSPTLCSGYDQYQKSLLNVPMPKDYGDASSDDLSSEWDSDVPEKSTTKEPKVSYYDIE